MEGLDRETREAAGLPPRGGWSPSTFLWALAAVLAARLLYLARYGWDLGWMNLLYLERARTIALGRSEPVEEQPLAFLALVAARHLGLDARQANEVVYLLAHLFLALGVLGIARFVWPEIAARRRRTLVATLALVPLLASQSGRNNLGVSLGAGLAASAVALAATAAATRSRSRVGTGGAVVLAAVVAGLASIGRYEALATCLGAALVFAFLGASMLDVPRHRGAALALGLGAVGGLTVLTALRHALGADAGADKTYAFYTFYDGLPLLMYPHPHATEYQRYAASAGIFGTFAENHGSLFHALVRHPGFALLRILTKPFDQLAALSWFQGLTPVGVALAVVGVRPGARPSDSTVPTWQRRPRVWLLAAYLLPLGMLFIPQQNPAYYVSIAVPLVLMVARGADLVGARLRADRARALGVATVIAALTLVIAAGKGSISNSRAINAAVPYLEQRCRDGCLTNVLPQALRDQLWVVTDAGAQLPPREHRSEQSIFRPRTAAPSESYEFCRRVRRSRAGGFTGPILYVDTAIETFTAFDRDFDPEVRLEGTVDRAGLVAERRFSTGPDAVVVYSLPAGRGCRSVAAP
ncbi:MAG TPA: hypothetical protein VLA79_06075 [Polyangia bacterium]|nr:hypothetical protein [Polyangia bacterium]